MYKSFQDIPTHPQIHYHITVDWRDLGHVIDRYITEHNLQLDPDFQRGHVWTKAQKTAFIEYVLQGGTSGKQIYFNHPGWMSTFKGDFVLVDGLQRITAVLDFLNNKVKAFGKYRNEYEGHIPSDAHFDFHIAKIQTKADVLKWYIFMNIGGTPHTKNEIKRVQQLLLLTKVTSVDEETPATKLKKIPKLIYKRDFEALYYKRFFAFLEKDDYFTYSDTWVPKEIVQLAEKYKVKVRYCSPSTPGYIQHGSQTMEVLDNIYTHRISGDDWMADRKAQNRFANR